MLSLIGTPPPPSSFSQQQWCLHAAVVFVCRIVPPLQFRVPLAATDVAHAHTNLLQLMHAVMGTLWASTCLRLGLGPTTTATGWGEGCPSSPGRTGPERMSGGGRVERTAGRLLKWDKDCNKINNDDDNKGGLPLQCNDNCHGNTNNKGPTMALTFEKLRGMLHCAIRDQASFLRDVL
jgi:hypothetical protein